MLDAEEVNVMEWTYDPSWEPYLGPALAQPYMHTLRDFLTQAYQEETVYPDQAEVLTALQWTPYERVKVVVLGQDPYHGPHQAHGLSFSVLPSAKIPPSLRNIYQELASDLGFPPVAHGYLRHWAEEGVLLLNTVLTVQAGAANSHRGLGWEKFTDEVIRSLNQRSEPIVFLLWGRPAQSKKSLIDLTKHYVLEAPHPSPLSAYRGFFGSRPFSQANEILVKTGQKPISWQLAEQV